MGVATDKSLTGLTAAVTNISTTGMSDTTGQAINTTLQSLVGAISPSALNVSFDNTGTGLSASNVQAAIAEICSDLFQTKTYTASYTVGGYASGAITASDFDISTPSGYSAIAIVDFATQSTNVDVRGVYARATGNNTLLAIRNVSSNSVTGTAYITILYAKSLFI